MTAGSGHFECSLIFHFVYLLSTRSMLNNAFFLKMSFIRYFLRNSIIFISHVLSGARVFDVILPDSVFSDAVLTHQVHFQIQFVHHFMYASFFTVNNGALIET